MLYDVYDYVISTVLTTSSHSSKSIIGWTELKKFTPVVPLRALRAQPTVPVGQQLWTEQPKSARPHLQILN